jgi:hypothetical protein
MNNGYGIAAMWKKYNPATLLGKLRDVCDPRSFFFDPERVDIYAGTTVVTHSGSRYTITPEGTLGTAAGEARDHILKLGGAKIARIGGIRDEDCKYARICARETSPSAREGLNRLLARHGNIPGRWHHLVLGFDDSTSTGRNGLVTSRIEGIKGHPYCRYLARRAASELGKVLEEMHWPEY